MERKIGEIFEFEGEWYQCIPDTTDDNCNNCFFQKRCSNITGDCSSTSRSDGKSVAFKKLEKVGEPYYSKYYGKFYQKYITYIPAVGYNFKIRIEPVEHVSSTEIYVELKQKEDMEEKKLNLKPFDLQKAKEGKPVCTKNGKRARIICFDFHSFDKICCIVAAVSHGESERISFYDIHGKYNGDKGSELDLMMSPEKKEGWVNLYKSSAYSTKEKAMKYRNKCNDYIDTIKIEWEE